MTVAPLGLRGWRRAVLPPAVAFLASVVVLSVAVAWAGHNPLRAATWESFDSPIYLEIAQYGYILRDCTPGERAIGATTCGNLGWFPLYPWLVHAGTWLGASRARPPWPCRCWPG